MDGYQRVELNGKPTEMNLTEFALHALGPIDNLFDPESVLVPMWLVHASDGVTIVATPWATNEEKKSAVNYVKQLVRDKNADRVAMVVEAWTLIEQKEIPESIALGGSIANHPERKEAIIVIAEERGNDEWVHIARYIERYGEGSAGLGQPVTKTFSKKDTKGTMTHIFGD